jgi:uncharacterized membrane protein YphA (DoxX/SURF4 family)
MRKYSPQISHRSTACCGSLGVLTAVAMLAANDFWAKTGHDRFLATNAFFEHLGLIAGFVLVALVPADQKARWERRPDLLNAPR